MSTAPATTESIRMVVGLGNPGNEYLFTRHNIGFMVLDRLASEQGFQYTLDKKSKAMVAKAGGILYAKPQTFMNLSGHAVSKLRGFYHWKAEEILVVSDEVNLPFGTLRLRPGGSAGGHNGMRSIIDQLGTDSFPRLRLGINRAQSLPDGTSLVGHVLGRFSPEEMELLSKCIDNAVQAIETIAQHGISHAMNQFNRKEN
ncbi:MAG: peptidyl-trna hydrolase [Verrucomicrobiaceae bacterium]|nr:peptidyl-trna hydrolase [Verrucomicrobiaceae bacterium]